MTRILFIGHDANRAGAQYLLLHLLTFLRKSGVETALLLGDGGPLLPDYERVTKVYAGFVPPAPPQPNGLITRAFKRLGVGNSSQDNDPGSELFAELLPVLQAQSFDLIFSNTIANGGLLQRLQPLGLPFVSYVHELETSIHIYTKPDELRYQLDHATLFLCGSDAVRQNLIQNHGLAPKKTDVLNSLIRTESLLSTLQSVDQPAIRTRLGIPLDAVVVGGCGNAEWRKGVDLFVLMAQQVLKTHPDTYFVWIGVPKKSEEYRRLTYDLERMRLNERVILIEPGGDYLNYFACFDIFTLTSREDPYPLVILEAGLNRIPVLCFRDSGGSPDFVGEDTGCLVAYSDVTALADLIRRLADAPDERSRVGAIFYQRAMNHDAGVLVPRLLAILETALNEHTP
ncbi:glycosyltransferase family 4 protein [Larkinella punicea]|uniref:Glycosyltransferase n=1 Tax=Larkinella punicea TaxID=2315727 RepID=A0A368JRP9_9BACT|nr:glycosyltransferase family 4 protein [Larkinella punicea]RCR69636.1 glycosyltransferase [Larkinella punicea]